MSTRKELSGIRKTGLVAVLSAISIGGFATAFVLSSRASEPRYVPIEPTTDRINWQATYEMAQAAARKSGKPLMISFHATWCSVCKEMEGKTYPDARVVREAKNFVPVQIDTDQRIDVAQQFQVSALPTILWLDGKGNLLGRVSGYYAPDELADLMRKVRSQPAPEA
ncbi:MAG TPA: thioredoxin family protein [Abditibacteriaceae bacterium]|jgi:thiol:disulfide interchange protein